jgi:hypothetical protein
LKQRTPLTLAINFGRKVRDLIDGEEYKELFPDTELKSDSRSAGKWLTSQGGEYYAAGIGGALAGRGADLFIIDDPHSEQDAMSDKAIRRSVRMVYVWTTTKATTWRCNRNCNDPLV